MSITAANIIAATGYSSSVGVAGATITAGQPLYIDATDSNKLKLCDCDSGTPAVRECVGISLHAALSGQPIKYISAGSLGMGAILTAGLLYCVSDVAGAIRPTADNGSGDYLILLGYASTTSNLVLMLTNTGVVLA